MNQLKVSTVNGQLVTDSREVAEMVDVQHHHLLRDIDNYVQVLGKSKIGLCEFFIESSYIGGNNRTYKSFLLTKKGCDMVANKMTGEKGVLFTAAYVTRFEEMEQQLRFPTVPVELPGKTKTLANIDQAIKLLQHLRVGEEGNLFNAGSSSAIRTQITDLVIGKAVLSSENALAHSEIYSSSEPKPSEDRWYTTKDIADLANVSLQKVAWISKLHKVKIDSAYCDFNQNQNREAFYLPVMCNELGKKRLLSLLGHNRA